MSKQAVCLMGPTASGKTAIACELMTHLPMEIISVDSAMVVQGLDIGTAKPEPDMLARAPHHLINLCNPNEAYSAAQFCTDATRVMHAIWQRGHIPLLVGGTMLYFRALQQGLSALPEADAATRAGLSLQLQEKGHAYMHAWLTEVDAISAQRIHLQDTQRVQRALEVYLLTSKPLSAHWDVSHAALNGVTFLNIGLFPTRRAWLHARIAERLSVMLADGFIQEVDELVQTWHLNEQSPAMRSVGYRQVYAYLQGEYDYETCCERILAATRQLAKRQLTWLRSWPGIHYIDPESPESSLEILAYLQQMLDNPD